MNPQPNKQSIIHQGTPPGSLLSHFLAEKVANEETTQKAKGREPKTLEESTKLPNLKTGGKGKRVRVNKNSANRKVSWTKRVTRNWREEKTLTLKRETKMTQE